MQDYLVRWKGFEALRLVQSTGSVGSADVKGVGLGLGVGVGLATTSLGRNMDGSPSVSVEVVKVIFFLSVLSSETLTIHGRTQKQTSSKQ